MDFKGSIILTWSYENLNERYLSYFAHIKVIIWLELALKDDHTGPNPLYRGFIAKDYGMFTPVTLPELLNCISPETVILTPNRRLAATLQQRYQEFQLKQNKRCWQTATILPFLSWIQRLWGEKVNLSFDEHTPLILNPTQETYLWEKVISASPLGETLLRVNETAELAHSAWKLLSEWRVPITKLLDSSNEDNMALYHWTTSVKALYQKNKWLDGASLLSQLIPSLPMLNLPKRLIFVGFNEFSPMQQLLQQQCQQLQIQVQSLNLISEKTQTTRLQFSETEDELTCLAQWAKKHYLESKHAYIGCVIPNLASNRDRVYDIFAATFNDISTDQAAFNISAGKSLIQYPLIQAAIQILQLYKTQLSLETLSYLLASPFIGDAEREYVQRAKFEACLRRNNIRNLKLADMIDPANKLNFITQCPRLHKRITSFTKLLDSLPAKQPFATWSNTISELLTIMGWPGERSLNSEEYQLAEHWLKLFAPFSSLDHVAEAVSFHQALHYLQQIATKTIFQPRTPDTRIQILGILEAAGMPFDYLWVSGLTDVAWPPQPNPNPFIPKKIQRELAMPHATAMRELEYCQVLTQIFLQSGSEIIVSHACYQDDFELEPSPLIRDIPLSVASDLKLPMFNNPTQELFQSRQIEEINDTQAPPIEVGTTITGGISILKQQALCPFKAFAEWRLHATELESPQPGLRAKDRGNIVHKTLELLWNNIQDHTTLSNFDDDTIDKRIHQAIDEAVANMALAQYQRKRYIELEKLRTYQLVKQWLTIEKDRPPFKVYQHESSTTITLNRLTINIRVDRIDQLADGRQLIIDYKTGKNNDIHDWLGDRPEEPQLPLYALLSPDNTVAISYAQLSPGAHAFKGISQYKLNITGITTIDETRRFFANSWEELTTQWQQVLTKLSDDFTMGIATVDPKDPSTTCTWCTLKPLCRIYEEDLVANAI